MMELSYRRHRFPPVVIQHAVWLYLRLETGSHMTLRWREMDSNYQYAGTVNVDDDAVARDIVRVAAAMAASARLARSVRVRTTQPSRHPHLSCERTLALVGISGRVASGRADIQQLVSVVIAHYR